MGYAKEMQHEQQQLVQSQMVKSDDQKAFDSNVDNQRRSANYKPNIWNYDFLQSLNSIYHQEKYERKAEELKEDVKKMFDEAVDQLAKLELIDTIRKLGLSSFFEDEIKEALDTIVSAMNKNPNNVEDHSQDLYATALCFRLLRLHNYQVSQDMFAGFIKEKGTFEGTGNTKAILELYEASQLGLENEEILDLAKDFSAAHLKGTIISKTDNINVVKQAAHSLALPLRWRVEWFSVRWHLNEYEKDEESPVNPKLLQLAKLNFNITQVAHQKDVQDISRWWRDLELIESMDFARDRLVESFMCALGLVSHPHFGSFRKWLTKVIIMILVIDDVYDIFGTLEELHQFTKAVDRWDMEEVEQLPECMQICFKALYHITNDTAFEIQKEMGGNQVLPHLKKVWADFCKASLLVEATWFNTGYKPSLKEYISNAWTSSSGPLILVHAFCAVAPDLTEEETRIFLAKNEDLIYNSSLVIRLCNDMGTSVAEKERGDVPSSILCYMRDENVSEEIAKKHIKSIIIKTLKKINKHCFSNPARLQFFVEIAANAARVAHSLYQYEDGFGVQDRKTRGRIQSLLVEPLVLN